MVEKKRKNSQSGGGLHGMETIDMSSIKSSALISPGPDSLGTLVSGQPHSGILPSPYSIGGGGAGSASHSRINLNELGAANEDSNQASRKKLKYAISICFLFFIIQLVGGIWTNSLALIADSFHLLTDCAAYAVALFALYISQKKATSRFSYGFSRAEVLGALVSVLLIWLLVFYLIHAATDRLSKESPSIDGKNMFILAVIGLIVNIILLATLGHDHDHDHDIDHHHSHHLLVNSPDTADSPEDFDVEAKSTLLKADGGGHHADKKHSNINVQAAILHALGDLLCSIGVLVASMVIMYDPQYSFVDPLCTFMFAIVVLITTGKIIRDIVVAMMEGVPVHVNPAKVHAALGRIEGVVEVEHFHISALTNEKLILTAHLIVAEKAAISAAARDHILERAQHVGKDELEGVVSMTFQITSR